MDSKTCTRQKANSLLLFYKIKIACHASKVNYCKVAFSEGK